MKNGLLSLTFTACLASSLAFADNPADAPLVTDDGNTTTTQRQNRNRVKSQQYINKDDSASSKRRQENGWRDQHDAQSPSITTGSPEFSGNYGHVKEKANE
jgi:hypothetical protein